MPSAEEETPIIENAADPAREELLEEIKDELGPALVGEHLEMGQDLTVRVQVQSWHRFGEVLSQKLGFTFFDFLSAIDWKESPFGRSLDSAVDIQLGNTEAAEAPNEEIETGLAGGDTRFQVFARLYSIEKKLGVTVKADLGEALEVQTWTDLFGGAHWHEREAYEMFGINFVGHENLRNIYLPSGFEGNPLRKDFPLMARLVKPWPGIVDVELMPEKDEAQAPKTTPSGASTQNPDTGAQ